MNKYVNNVNKINRYIIFSYIFSGLLIIIPPPAQGQNLSRINHKHNNHTISDEHNIVFNNLMAQSSNSSDHWTDGCLDYLQQKGVINSASDLRLNEPIQRVELAAMIAQAYQNIPPIREAIDFIDIPDNYWGKSAVQSAYIKGFMNSYVNGLFNPTATMTRVEVLLALTKGLKLTASDNIDIASLKQTFRDAQDIPTYARNSILAATEKGLIINYPDPQILNPNLISTRWDTATLICQSLRVKNNAPINMSGEYVVKINPISKTSQVIKQYNRNNLQVILSYDRPNPQAEQTGLLTNLNLQIQRNQAVLLDSSILSANLVTPLPSRPQSAGTPQAKITDVKLVDLNGDNELEVIVDLIAINSNLPDGSYSFIYEYIQPKNQYSLTTKNWDNLQYNLTDFNNDQVLEFNTFDWRFASVFPDTTANVGNYLLPIQIWQYDRGKMTDITRQFPIQVKNSAANLWLEFNKQLSKNQETKGVLASYLATQYLLNQSDQGWQDLNRFYVGSDRTNYFKNLSEFLTSIGYTNNNPNNNPNNNISDSQPLNRSAVNNSTNNQSANNQSANNQSAITTNPANTINPTSNPTDNSPIPSPTATTNTVVSIALSPDSKILASTSGKNILIWSIADKKLLTTLAGHNGDVRSLAISSDNQILASGSGDGTVKIWNINSGELIKTFWHSGWVTGVGFSTNGDGVIGVSADKGLKIWDIKTAAIIRTVSGYSPIAIAPASQLMATSGGPRSLRLWQTDGQLIRNLSINNPQSVSMKAIALSNNGEIMAHTMSGEKKIYLWNISMGKIIGAVTIKSSPVQAIALSPDGLVLAVISQDGKTSLWQTKNNQLLRELYIGKNAMITFMPDSQILISVDNANGVRFWQVNRY